VKSFFNPPTKGNVNKRIKRTGAVLKSRAEMEAIVGEIRHQQIIKQGLLTHKNHRQQALDAEYAEPLQEVDRDLEKNLALVQAWAESNPDDFGDRKSIETQHGTIGFRTGTPKLKTITRWKWDMVLEALKSLGWGKDYVRVEESINKDGLLRAHSAGFVTDAGLRQAGCQVVQEESFYVEPKMDEVDSRQVVKEAA
jgi:phage host-nuclease inhibitor protein Gam